MTTVSLNENTSVMQKIIDFPDQIKRASALMKNHKTWLHKLKQNKFTNVVILGMGGSGIVGDLSKILARNSTIPVHVCKNAVPPSFISADSLVIAITYSGKTRETLKALDACVSAGAKTTVVVTSSFDLGSVCSEKNIPWILVPQNDYPRFSLGYMLIPVLEIFEAIGVLSSVDKQISESIDVLNSIKKECGANIPSKNNPAWLVAEALAEGFPVLYGEYNFTDAIAQRWKQQLNENSKIQCYHDTFPELLHNEVEVWSLENVRSNSQPPIAILLRDQVHEHAIGINESVDAASDLIASRGARVIEVWTKGNSEIARILSQIYIGDFVSVYLANLRGIDASIVPNIEYMKNARPVSNLSDMKQILK